MSKPRYPRGMANLLSALPARLPRPATVGDLLNALGDQGVAVVLLIFAVPAIVPTPGIPAGLVFGTALALLSVQIMLGVRRLWLPNRLADISVPRSLIDRAASHGAPLVARLERYTKQRGTMHPRIMMRPLLGLVIFAMAILIALPIPFGNMLPGIAVLITALGIAQRDSLAIGAGLLVAILAVAMSAALLVGGWALIADWMAIDRPPDGKRP